MSWWWQALAAARSSTSAYSLTCATGTFTLTGRAVVSGVFTTLASSNITTVSTYNSISIEVTATGPTTSNTNNRWGGCRLKYRVHGASTWKDAIDLPWDTGVRDGATLTAQYRGSLLKLQGGTAYDIRVIHDDLSYRDFTATTRTEVANLPIGSTQYVSDSSSKIILTTSGTAGGYREILPQPPLLRATIDLAFTDDYGVQLGNGSALEYLIIRHIDVKRTNIHGFLFGSIEGLNTQAIKNIIVDDCTVTNWGSEGSSGCAFAGNGQSAFYSHSSALENITIQQCHVYSPALGANSWAQTYCTGGAHPKGTQAITFLDGIGGHVIRYCTLEGGVTVHFNDACGATSGNFSALGFPGANCDFHNLIIQYVWDDALEIEGRDRNIRIWDVLVNEVYHGLAIAPVYEGPIYVWGLVGRISRSDASASRGQNLIKWRRTQATGGTDWSGGHVFVFQCTTLPQIDSSNRGFKQAYAEEEAGDSIRNWHFWNNIIQNDVNPTGETTKVAFEDPNGSNNEIKNNLLYGQTAGAVGGWTTTNEPGALVSGNANARANYATNSWNGTSGVGKFLLNTNSTQANGFGGYQEGLPTPNVLDGIANPDMGAHQSTWTDGVGYGHLNMVVAGSTSLTASTGTFALTGNAAAPSVAHKLTASAGAFTLTGRTASLLKGLRVSAATGSFILTGSAASFALTRKLSGAAGAFTLTGNTAALFFGLRMTAAAGSFALTGQSAGLFATHILAGATGSFSLTGNAAALMKGRTLSVSAGAFALTGRSANFAATRKLVGSVGAFALTGFPALLTRGRILQGASGSFVLTGYDMEFSPVRTALFAAARPALVGVSGSVSPASPGTFTKATKPPLVTVS